MPKKNKTKEEHLETIELTLAAILLERDVDVGQISKIMGLSDKTLSKLDPEKKKKINKQ